MRRATSLPGSTTAKLFCAGGLDRYQQAATAVSTVLRQAVTTDSGTVEPLFAAGLIFSFTVVYGSDGAEDSSG
jgi:hypothetical protein